MADLRTPPSHEPLSQLAARVLRNADALAPARAQAADGSGEREKHLALLAGAATRAHEERVRASRRRWTGAAIALAAVVVAAVGFRAVVSPERVVSVVSTTPSSVASTKYDVHIEGDGAEIARAATPSAAHAPELVGVGDRVTSKAAGVAIVVATGTKLTLDKGTDVSVVEGGRAQVFALGAGSVRADVAKLHEGERFVVRTADVEVEVRGTSFRVERVDAAPPCRPDIHTRVIVTEGVVVVRQRGAEDRVKAGEQWPPACAPVPTEGENAPPVGPTSSIGSGSVPSAPSSTALPPPSGSSSGSASPSKLAASNELFAKAAAARKGGDARGAVALFDKLLAEYPGSPIVESATVERMRTLDAIDRARSVAAARDYLARFPHGFARGEAEAIVALGP